MQLIYHLPRPDLRDYVRAYYYFETDARIVQPLPAELGNIRCLIEGSGCFRLADGSTAPFAAETLIGPTLRAYAIEAEPGARAFGVGILPRGWRVLLGIDAAEIADRVVDLSALSGRAASAAAERIRNARSLAEMAGFADAYFAGLIERRSFASARYPAAFERWLLHPDDLGLDALVEMMDCSRRQIDRLAKRYFGGSPKLLQRKYRALRAADRILLGGARDWKEAAGESFYDQSHFIKEFRAFIGASPRDYARNMASLGATIQIRRRSLIERPQAASL